MSDKRAARPRSPKMEAVFAERIEQRRRLDALQNIPKFDEFLKSRNLGQLRRTRASILQVNIGLKCDLQCVHCHVDAGPNRKETMTRDTAERLLHVARNSQGITTIDLTGGAPELNPQFRFLVQGARQLGYTILDRCNLTCLFEPGQEDLADFLTDNRVHVIASLPCYTKKNVTMQRGTGTFDKSIQGLLELNKRGYGKEAHLPLTLVYNPGGPFLPGDQKSLEEDYRRILRQDWGIEFTQLYTITNVPIKRFADQLFRLGELQKYMELLVNNFNPATVHGLMCHDTLNVRWDGALFDCDFNQQIDLGMGGGPIKTIFDINSADDVTGQPIGVGMHCFACTAGSGSSCGGAVV